MACRRLLWPKTWPPDPIETVTLGLGQQRRDKKASVGLFGSRTGVPEVLRKGQAVSLAMVRRLNQASLHASRLPNWLDPYGERCLAHLLGGKNA